MKGMPGTEPGKTRREWDLGTGYLSIERRGSLVILIRMSGQLTGVGHELAKVMDDLLSEGPNQTIFCDMGNLTGYDSPLRLEGTRTVVAHRKHLLGVHVLTGSRLTRMGVTVAGLAMGNLMTSHAEASTFEGALRTALLAPPPKIDDTP